MKERRYALDGVPALERGGHLGEHESHWRVRIRNDPAARFTHEHGTSPRSCANHPSRVQVRLFRVGLAASGGLRLGWFATVQRPGVRSRNEILLRPAMRYRAWGPLRRAAHAV